MKRHLLPLTLICVLTAGTAVAHEPIGEGAEALPIFDAHVHYKAEAWGPYPPGAVIELMDKSGVAMALVSSTPDEGTVRLYEYAPNRIVPEVRPYHEGWGQSNWTGYDGMFDYIKGRMNKYPHVGIGEFHLHDIEKADETLLRRIAELAAERGALLHVHSGPDPVKFFYRVNPGLTIIWAHAGMSAPPSVIGPLMDKHEKLYADLSYREWEILDGDEGPLNPAWETLLTRHAERFMVGTDTWVNEQWAQYDRLVAMNRAWLARFPRDLAEKFAYRNAERLFGREVSRDLIGTR